MHQTFYIDIDEEVSSVVDRLDKSMSFDNFFVIPKRAVVLQSAVNLKLLKREADKLNKRVFIVTLDETGASMAKRSGIEVLKSLEGIEQEQETLIIDEDDDRSEDLQDEVLLNTENKSISHLKNARLRNVGSSDFYGETKELKKEKEDEFIPHTKKSSLKHHDTKSHALKSQPVRHGMDMHVKKRMPLEPNPLSLSAKKIHKEEDFVEKKF